MPSRPRQRCLVSNIMEWAVFSSDASQEVRRQRPRCGNDQDFSTMKFVSPGTGISQQHVDAGGLQQRSSGSTIALMSPAATGGHQPGNVSSAAAGYAPRRFSTSGVCKQHKRTSSGPLDHVPIGRKTSGPQLGRSVARTVGGQAQIHVEKITLIGTHIYRSPCCWRWGTFDSKSDSNVKGVVAKP